MVTAALRCAQRRVRVPLTFALVARLPIDIDRDPPDAGMLLALALRYDLTSYDAAYLELALRLQLPIATQDTELAMAARIAGVGVVGAE